MFNILRSPLYPSYADLWCASQLPIRQTEPKTEREDDVACKHLTYPYTPICSLFCGLFSILLILISGAPTRCPYGKQHPKQREDDAACKHLTYPYTPICSLFCGLFSILLILISGVPAAHTANRTQNRERMMRCVNTRPVWTKVAEPFPLCVP